MAVLAWDGERVALVRQWRHAAESALLEIPAGTMEDGEDAALTAQRELAEEMGVGASAWTEGPSFYTAPGFCTERLTLFLATGLAPVDVATPDDEDLDRSWFRLADAVAAIDSGLITDAKSIVGILWLARRLE